MIEFALGGVVTIVVAGLGAWAAAYQARQARHSADRAVEAAKEGEFEEVLAKYRAELDDSREELRTSLEREHLHFMWNRQMYAHIYAQKPPPPPEAPPGLFRER